MNRKPIFGALRVVLVVLAALALTAGSASADVIINFIDNDSGIHVTGTAFDGTPFDFTKPGAETFHISSPAVPPGYTPDAILSHIGISRTSPGYLVNILESPGGPISDQVFVYQFIPIFTVIDFISDPDQFFSGTPDFTFVETGGLQNVLNYFNDRGELVSINVQSELDTPEPASLTLLGIAGFCFGGYSWRRRKLQVAKA